MERIRKETEKINIAELISEMVKIPSYSFMAEQEKKIAFYIKAFFDKEGISCGVTEIADGRYNVDAVIKGTGGGKSLLLTGHIDTVPPYDMEDAFSGRIEDGKVFGRGACDMKGPLASMMTAMAALKRSGVRLKGDLYFSGVADEEEKGMGTAYLIKNGVPADGVVVGEPTSLAIAPGHKGLEWIEIEFTGKKVHGGRQKDGINAVEMAARFINRLYEEYVPLLESRAYPVLGAPTVNVGTISGGDQPSTVPDKCTLTLDRRMVPSETIPQVYAELEEIGTELHCEDPRFNCTVRDVFEGSGILPHIPFVTDEDDPLMIAVKEACEENGAEIKTEPFPAWTDAGFIAAGTNSKCVVLGPGALAVAHSADEYIDVSEAYKAAEIYALCALKYCGEDL